MTFKRATNNETLAHVFFTSEGYDDFRKVRDDGLESKLNLPNEFNFATAVPRDEYDTKLAEWDIIRKLPNDVEMMRIISEM